MSDPAALPSKDTVTLLLLTWGDRYDAEPFGEERSEQSLAICDGSSPVLLKDRSYYPIPNFEIKLVEDKGGFDDGVTKIRVPLKVSGNSTYNDVIGELASSNAFAPVRISVMTVSRPSAGRPRQETVDYLFDGQIQATRKFENEARNILTIEAIGDPGLAETTLGFALNSRCPFAFGSLGCMKEGVRIPYHATNRPNGLALNAYVEIFGSFRDHKIWVYTLDPALSGRLTTVPDGWWEKGYLERDGLRLTIREWADGTHSFTTAMPAPQSWFGTVFDRRPVLLVPGCYGEVEDCRLRGQEERFGGFGYGIPANNPVTEQDDR